MDIDLFKEGSDFDEAYNKGRIFFGRVLKEKNHLTIEWFSKGERQNEVYDKSSCPIKMEEGDLISVSEFCNISEKMMEVYDYKWCNHTKGEEAILMEESIEENIKKPFVLNKKVNYYVILMLLVLLSVGFVYWFSYDLSELISKENDRKFVFADLILPLFYVGFVVYSIYSIKSTKKTLKEANKIIQHELSIFCEKIKNIQRNG